MAWVYHNKPPMGWPLDLSEPINDGLVGYWYMPEGSGNKVFDLSGNGNVGVITDSTWIAGKFGSALQANSDSGAINVGTMSVLDGLSAMSFVCWAKIDEASIVGDRLFGWDDGTDKWQAFWDGSDIRTRLDAGGTNEIVNGPDEAIFAYDNWFQYACTYDGVNLTVYLNGLFHSSVAITGAHDIDPGTDFGLMSDLVSASASWQFPYSHAMIYKRGLIASEIALLYQFPFYGFLNPDEEAVLDQYYSVGVPTKTYHYKQAGGL